MNNADMPVMPTLIEHGETAHNTEPTYGLTKREIIAMHIIASLIQNGAINEIGNEDWYAKRACQLSDALLVEL